MVQIAQWRASEALPAGLRAWAHEMKAVGIPQTERVREIIEMVALEKLKQKGVDLGKVESMTFSTKQTLLKDVYVDVSQNPKHKSCTNAKGITGCLATSTCLYSYGRDRVVLPTELSMIQGHRRGFFFPETMSSNQIRDLAGEGMNLPCLGTILWCMYLTKGFP